MTGPGDLCSRSNRAIARTEDNVSFPVSSNRILLLWTPDSMSRRAMAEASDGPYRPTAPVGMKRVSGCPAAAASAVSTRRRSVILGCPLGRMAAPKIRIVSIRSFDVRFPIENNLEDAIIPSSCAARLWVSSWYRVSDSTLGGLTCVLSRLAGRSARPDLFRLSHWLPAPNPRRRHRRRRPPPS
jgi:hypothetical protein